MSITRIKSLRNIGVFYRFDWPSELPTFGRFNLIYGWNGSGKTTLSRILRDLELGRDLTAGDVTLTIANQDLGGAEFSKTPEPIRVFNRDFITENVFPIGGGDVPPIIILGKENIENQKKLDSLTVELEKLEELNRQARQQLRNTENMLDNHCIERGSVVKSLLRKPGTNPYNNYDKRNYARQAQIILEGYSAQNHKLDNESRTQSELLYRASPLLDIDEILFSAPNFKELTDKVSNLLQETVISQTIQSLRDNAETSRWVRLGLDLHKKQSALNCLFCGQILPSNLISTLEGHFSAAYEKLMSSLDEAGTEIANCSESITLLNLPIRSQFYQFLGTEYDLLISEVNKYIGIAKGLLDFLQSAIENKKVRPFDSIALNMDAASFPDAAPMDELNSLIRKHNRETKHHGENSVKAGQQLELGLVSEQSEVFADLSTKVKIYESIVTSLDRRQEVVRANIVGLQLEITEHVRPAEELNDDLFNYLGHNELQLQVKDNGYTLTRNGIAASQLSEGEVTAIALLYFIKTLTDHRFDLSKGIVVLDDPVSSLDANSLFLACGFIRERTRGAGQLFLLTHNFTFFREMRNWFHHMKGQKRKDISKRPARFYMLSCASSGQGRQSTIRNLDPLLERYESDYHYLFACVANGASSSTAALEANYALPNMARRLLEAFLAFRQPDAAGDLREKMQNVDFNAAEKSQILRFVHNYSHNDAIVEPDHDISLLSEAPTVLSSLLGLIQKEDPRHFERMMNVISHLGDDEDEQ